MSPFQRPVWLCLLALAPCLAAAILLAALYASGTCEINEPATTRDHTERMLRAQGAPLSAEPREGGWFVELQAMTNPLQPLDMEVPGDPSSAAFLVALALFWLIVPSRFPRTREAARGTRCRAPSCGSTSSNPSPRALPSMAGAGGSSSSPRATASAIWTWPGRS